MERDGWALVAPDGEIWGFAPTKRDYLDALMKSKVHKQAWVRELLGKKVTWRYERATLCTFREVWPSYYRRGFRFVRARETIVITGASNGQGPLITKGD